MSHYSTVQTEFTDRALLVKALNVVGFDTVEVHDNPTGLYGYQGDLRSQKAHVIVRRKFVGVASNDLGFAKRSDGKFEAIISDYDKAKLNDKWLVRLKTEYAKLAIVDFAKAQGFELSKATNTPNGNTRYVMKKRTFVASEIQSQLRD